MSQLGEGIGVGIMISDTHTEATCPWHTEDDSGSAAPMDAQEADEDSHGPIPANLGKKLGKNLRKGGFDPPATDQVTIAYKAADVLALKGGKKILQTYESTVAETYVYPLQYAPHHLIPGNESLKESEVLVYMGDDSVIEGYKPPGASRIKSGKSIGYDVNASDNGVWLPSPYALSNKNKWPEENAIKTIMKVGHAASLDTETFKNAYAAAAIEAAGNRQFHMRHDGYSIKVKEILDAMANKLDLLATVCPVAKGGKKADKFDPPAGLKARLNNLSTRLRTLLIGRVWRPPLFTDALTEQYVSSLPSARKTDRGYKLG